MAGTILGANQRGGVIEGRRDGITGEAKDVEDWEGGCNAARRFAAEVHPWLGVEGEGPGEEAGRDTMLGRSRESPSG